MVSDPDALGVWITELDSNSFLDGLRLPLEFPRQIISPILASIAVVRGVTRGSSLLGHRSALLNFGVPRQVARVPTALRETAAWVLRQHEFFMSSVTDLTLPLFAR